MEFKQNPFSLYDFLGYFVPGALFLYGLYFALALHSRTQAVFSSLSDLVDFSRIELYLPFILSAYLVGHILSFMSSIIVERYSVWKVVIHQNIYLALGIRNILKLMNPKVLELLLEHYLPFYYYQ